MRILHILHRSLPGTHGYAIRSKYIVECQKQLSYDPIVITSPFQSASKEADSNPEYINGIPYYRTGVFGKTGSRQVRSSNIWISALRFPLVFLFAYRVLEVAKRVKPSIIHAHSPFYCGLVASFVSKILGIPCIYEVRGIWENSSIMTNNKKSIAQGAMRFLENQAMLRVNSIVVISEHLKTEIKARGINNKVYIIPNGVDTQTFTFTEKSKELLEELSLNGKIILGYIGTLSADYEGLEYIIQAMPKIIKECPEAMLVIVGDGRMREILETLSNKLEVNKNVIFVGRMPHDKIPEYYSIIDISIFPRVSTAETELVTPLKPFEAMACGKPIIGSNVGGIEEIVSDEKTGLLFEAANTEDLTNKCINLIEDSKKRALLGQQAKEWVVENRDWMKVVRLYKHIYENLLS